MKSTVLSYPDPRSIRLSPKQRTVTRCDLAEEIEKELDIVRRKHAEVRERETGEAVSAGDALTIDVSCDRPDAPAKFRKTGIGLRLGKGFYDKCTEDALLGKGVGDTVAVNAGKDGEWPVRVTIVSAQHTVLRPLTDEDFVEEGKLNGVDIHNEEEYIAFLKDAIRDAENLDHFYDHILDDVSAKLVCASTFSIDEEEFQKDVARWHKDVEDLPDLPPSDDEDGFIPYVQELTGSSADTRDALEEALTAYYKDAFCYNLILLDLAKDEPDPPREALDAILSDMRAEGYSEEDLAEAKDYDQYVKNHKLEIGQQILMDILYEQLEN